MKIETKTMVKQTKLDWWEFPSLFLDGFLFIFIMFYLSKFGMDNFLIQSTDTWGLLFNIAIFYVMTLFFLNGFLTSLTRFKK